MKLEYMKLSDKIKNINWVTIVVFYFLICCLSFLFLKFPNLIKELCNSLFDLNLPFNWNHGIALLIVSLISYPIFKVKRKTTLLGNNRTKSILLSAVVIVAYTLFGFSNDYGINPHLWAFIFCSFTLIYDLFEESAWRGFLNDNLNSVPFWLKGIFTGVVWGLWHLIIFDNFDQFGGLHIFVLLCILLSIIIAYATDKTNSILVAASIHTLFCKSNYVTLICFVILVGLIITWNKKSRESKSLAKIIS